MFPEHSFPRRIVAKIVFYRGISVLGFLYRGISVPGVRPRFLLECRESFSNIILDHSVGPTVRLRSSWTDCGGRPPPTDSDEDFGPPDHQDLTKWMISLEDPLPRLSCLRRKKIVPRPTCTPRRTVPHGQQRLALALSPPVFLGVPLPAGGGSLGVRPHRIPILFRAAWFRLTPEQYWDRKQGTRVGRKYRGSDTARTNTKVPWRNVLVCYDPARSLALVV